jgi:antitoxin HicB
MTKKTKNRHRGPQLDDVLAEDGILGEFQAVAIKEVVAFQIDKAMRRDGITKTKMAEKMRTSRAQLNRLLDPTDGNVTLETLQKAATVLGRSIRVQLV